MLGSPGLPAIAGPSDIIDATSSITRMPEAPMGGADLFMSAFINMQEILILKKYFMTNFKRIHVEQGCTSWLQASLLHHT